MFVEWAATLAAVPPARVIARRPLFYAAGADPAEDRPAHVRAGSGVAWLGSRLLIVQDDAAFVATLEGWSSPVEAIALPRLEDGRRQHDDRLGTKHLKLDLESCVAVRDDARELALAFGSGSARARERVLVLDAALAPRLVHAGALFEALRALPGFATSELNLEGAFVVGDRLAWLQRSNGAATSDAPPRCAIGDVALGELLDHLERGAPCPTPRLVAQVDLGAIDGCRLTFTDATTIAGKSLFVASAEASPDALQDGPVLGVRLGRFVRGAGGGLTGVETCALLDEHGAPLSDKVEGLARDPDGDGYLWAVVDRDDPDAPCELLRIQHSL